MPHLHEMDFIAFVKRWADEEQKSAPQKKAWMEIVESPYRRYVSI